MSRHAVRWKNQVDFCSYCCASNPDDSEYVSACVRKDGNQLVVSAMQMCVNILQAQITMFV